MPKRERESQEKLNKPSRPTVSNIALEKLFLRVPRCLRTCTHGSAFGLCPTTFHNCKHACQFISVPLSSGETYFNELFYSLLQVGGDLTGGLVQPKKDYFRY